MYKYKYKIGQKVRISQYIRSNTYLDGVYINEYMAAHINSIYIITQHGLFKGKPVYCLNESCWLWSERMLCNDNFVSLNEYV